MQSLVQNSWMLIAEQDRWREMGAGFRGDRATLDMHDVWIGLAALSVVILFFLILAKITARQDTRRIFNSPAALFRGLCNEHHLDRSERKLLKQMARAAGYDQPARLFLEPGCFEPRELSAALRSQLDQIAVLRVKLFGEPRPVVETSLQQTVELYTAVHAS